MSFPVRAYLILQDANGEWLSTVHRDLQSVLKAWAERPRRDAGGVLHLGFDRPTTDKFVEVVSKYPGRLLVTSAAKYGLPKEYEASNTTVGIVEGIPLHVGTKGWGYAVEMLEDIAEAPLAIAKNKNLSGWVEEFTHIMPEYKKALLLCEIFDEESYLENEGKLEKSLRKKIGIHRFRALGGDATQDPITIARCAPPWLLERSVSSLGLTVRVSNVFVWSKINTVDDLTKLTQFDLLRMPNFGRKSLGDLKDSLISALDEGPFALEEKLREAGATSLEQEIKKTLETFDKREKDILARRMGLFKAPDTLQAIADSYGITRERIRQIEDRCVKTLIKEAYWDDLLADKLKVLLLGRDYPLPVLGVEALDKWFTGFTNSGSALRYILENICIGRVGITHLDGIDYFGFLKQKEWETALSEARQFLQTAPGQRWSEEYCRSIVFSYLKDDAKEFRMLLWEKAAKLCHFSGEAGHKVLIAYGYGVEHAVEAILAEAEEPIHYTKIVKLTEQRLNREVDVRRAHNSAASVGILFGPGLYGSEKHLKFLDDYADQVCEVAEDIILNDSQIRQWHTSEILSSLSEREEIEIEKLDKYKLNHILKRSSVLKSLGRMTWAEAQTGISEMAERIEIRQAIIRLLQNAGRPLSTPEIKQQLIAVRGINHTFQIPSNDPIIRLDTKYWGLNDRDILIKRAEQPFFREKIIELLERKQSGIHVTEFLDFEETGREGLSAQITVSLAVHDPRIRISPSQYLYLNSWGAPRRETLASAILNILKDSHIPLTISEITERVKQRTGLSSVRNLYSCLYGLNATYDTEAQGWIRGEQVASDTEEELEEEAAVGF